MHYETITLQETGGIATLTLNRPKVMNALSRTLRIELLAAIQDVQTRARVIVLTGAGSAFCSGQELYDADALAEVDFEATLRGEYEPLLLAIQDCPVPVIAAVNGVAAGAGANLALGCDVVIASESASFIQAFTRIGLIPDAGGTYWLPRQIGFARAMGAMLFADKISARQAETWGMIYEAVPDESFADRVQQRALALATGPSTAFGALKAALRQSASNDLRAQLALEAKLQASCGKTADFHEGVSAFRQKRAARFIGR